MRFGRACGPRAGLGRIGLLLQGIGPRRAVLLWAQGYRTASADPGEPTISRALGCSERSVRYYLRQAPALLGADLDPAGLTVPQVERRATTRRPQAA